MSVLATELKAPEELLRDMLAETQIIRGLVANPDDDWDTLAAKLDVGGIAAGDVLDHIKYAFLEEDEDHEDHVARPRLSIRQLDDDVWTRDGGFTLAGSLLVQLELPIASSLAGRSGPAVLDARRKLYYLTSELLELQATSGRLRITSLVSGPVGLNDPKEDGEDTRFLIGDFIVRFDGAT